MVAEFRARRDLLVAGLAELPGVSATLPDGAFYAFPDIGATGLDGATFAGRLLDEAGVSVLAGTAFGQSATNHLRISYANSRPNLQRALERLADFVAALPAA
jgi:aspartate/methionine/tyrosine aminotransferase